MSNVDVIFIIGSSPLSVCCLHIRLLAWPGPGWDDTKISPSPDIDCILMSKREEERAVRDTRDNAVSCNDCCCCWDHISNYVFKFTNCYISILKCDIMENKSRKGF